jgi:hypothetical protein
MSDAEVLLDLQQQRLERAVGFELMNTSQLIIKRSGIFDNVDAKYGIPEEEREKAEAAASGGEAGAEMGGMDMGGGAPPAEAPAAGAEPLSESTSRKSKILGMLGEEKEDFNILFDMNKAQQNIYEIETKITDILND